MSGEARRFSGADAAGTAGEHASPDGNDVGGEPESRAPWAASIFVAALANERATRERDERRAKAEAEAIAEHARECAAAVCARCSKFACGDCGASVRARDARCLACQLSRARADFAKQAGIDQNFLDALWADPIALSTPDAHGETRVTFPSDQLNAVMQWGACMVTPPHFVLLGPTLSGKTSMLVAMLGARFVGQFATQSAHVSGMRFLKVIDIANDFTQHTAGWGKPGEAELVARARRATVLGLDDLGRELMGGGPKLAALMKDIIRTRMDRGRPTWITSWLTHAEMTTAYGGDLADRLQRTKNIKRVSVVRLGTDDAARTLP